MASAGLIAVPLVLHLVTGEGEIALDMWPTASFAAAIALTFLFFLFECQTRRLARSRVSISHRSEAYTDIIEGYFAQWKLTRSERTVALYVMKGFSNAEIASLRQTSEATIKSQLNAIYRKAGVTSRQQLACFIFEDFIQLPDGGAEETDPLALTTLPRLAPTGSV